MFCSCRISTHKCLARSLCNSRATCTFYAYVVTRRPVGIPLTIQSGKFRHLLQFFVSTDDKLWCVCVCVCVLLSRSYPQPASTRRRRRRADRGNGASGTAACRSSTGLAARCCVSTRTRRTSPSCFVNSRLTPPLTPPSYRPTDSITAPPTSSPLKAEFHGTGFPRNFPVAC